MLSFTSSLTVETSQTMTSPSWPQKACQSPGNKVILWPGFKKIISPTSEEIKKHKEYLKKNLKNNNFN